MNTAAKSLVLTLTAVATVLLLLMLAAPAKRAPAVAPSAAVTAPATAAVAETPPALDMAAGDNEPDKYFFDVTGHSAEAFLALLNRAHAIYEDTPAERRSELEIVMVLHGPDIEFFDRGNYAEHHAIVDLAARLDAFGVFDFKVCTVAAEHLGVTPDDVPPFIEFVPYGPGEIDRLEEAGFVRL